MLYVPFKCLIIISTVDSIPFGTGAPSGGQIMYFNSHPIQFQEHKCYRQFGII